MSVQRIALMIGGAQKSGTTSLFRYLAQHPEVHTHQSAEMSFFVNDHEFEGGDNSAWKKYFGAAGYTDRQLIAKHVLLMYSKPALQRLLQHNPEVHLVLMLRNPVDRAYSAYWYARRKGLETIESFADAVSAEPERLKQGWYRWRQHAYLTAGRYAEFIDDMRDVVSADHLHVYSTQDLAHDANGICKRLFATISVDSTFCPDTRRQHNPMATARSQRLASAVQAMARSRNPARNLVRRLLPAAVSHRIRRTINTLNEVRFEPPPLDASLRAELIAYFRPHNERLSKVLGRSFDDWNV